MLLQKMGVEWYRSLWVAIGGAHCTCKCYNYTVQLAQAALNGEINLREVIDQAIAKLFAYILSVVSECDVHSA